MMYEIELTAEAESHLIFWSKNDKKTLKRMRTLIANMQETPYTGLGKPEALRHEWSGFYSRRIDSQHRLVGSSSKIVEWKPQETKKSGRK